MRWQAVAAGALLVGLAAVAVVALTGEEDQPEAMASPAATASPSPSPSPSPTPSPSPSPELVLPDNDVDDPLEAIVAIEAYRDWLFENPDPELVRFIYHPECGCTAPLEEALRVLQADGEYVRINGSTSVEDASVVREEEGGRVVTLEYTAVTPPLQLMSTSGEEVERRDEPETRALRVSLVRDGSGRWLVTLIQDGS